MLFIFGALRILHLFNMLNRLFLSLGFILTFALVTFAQNNDDLSWRKHRKLAESLVEKGFFQDAATHYESAFKKNTDKKELIYLAGENFYKAKDFVKAAESYKFVKDEKDKDFDLVGLKYAKSLKQSGDYESAIREFTYFENAYNGDQKVVLKDFISKEIKGCELGMKLEGETPKIVLNHLNENVNTSENELAPIAFSDDILYYTSTLSGKRAMIYRSQFQNGVWSKYAPASGLPTVTNAHLANGCFSPDGQRFYFTQCALEQTNEKKSKNKNEQVALCEIFVIKKQDEGWSSPIRLRDYINLKGFTTTHPNIVHTDDKEILYFSSDREGGKGGMDLWYCVRDLKSNDIDFTFPKNLGGNINTKGDEITPYFDAEKGVLFFSSNGLITIGGLDIFSSKGSLSNWEQPNNIGIPFNSAVDDYYYTEKKNRTGGFLVSNRMVAGEKNNTINEDIFEFVTSTKAPEMFARGSLFDKKSLNLLKEVTVSLYEMNNGDKQLLTTKVFSDGVYQIQVLANKEYVLEADKDGFQTGSIKINTKDKLDANNIGESIYLNPSIPMDNTVAKVETKTEETTTVVPAKNNTNNPTTNTNKKEPKKQMNNLPNNDTKVVDNNSKKNTNSSTTNTATTTETTTKVENKIKPAVTGQNEVVSTDTKAESVKNSTATTKPIKENKPTKTDAQSQQKEVVVKNSKPTTSSETASKPVTSEPIVNSSASNTSPVTHELKDEGETFKVQIGAHAKYQPEHIRYANLEEYGVVETDETSHPGLTRVLIGNVASRAEAIVLQRRLKMKGFRDAFIVTYSGINRITK